jgi:murein DD-endopeptidase MepM/ murein hydrolase activator NlpD
MGSEIQLTFYERFVLASQKLKKKLSKLHKLGQTKVGVLFIPHNHENIAKFEITVYLGLFISTLSVLLFSMSIGYGVSYLTSSSKAYIFEKGHQQKTIFLHHSFLASEFQDAVTDLANNVEDLNKVTWGRHSKDFLQDIEIEVENQNPEFASFFPRGEEMKSNMKIFKETVDHFSEIHSSLSALRPIFSNAADYLETRESIVQSMPRGRPLGPGVGFIASTFGNREDPVKGGGEFHNGVDFAAPRGTPIYASAPGVVGEASYSESSWGNYVKLHHENGFYTLYAHCSELKVSKGDKVKRGDLIALVGSTGKSTGYHLHYEVHIGLDPAINPQEFINID